MKLLYMGENSWFGWELGHENRDFVFKIYYEWVSPKGAFPCLLAIFLPQNPFFSNFFKYKLKNCPCIHLFSLLLMDSPLLSSFPQPCPILKYPLANCMRNITRRCGLSTSRCSYLFPLFHLSLSLQLFSIHFAHTIVIRIIPNYHWHIPNKVSFTRLSSIDANQQQ